METMYNKLRSTFYKLDEMASYIQCATEQFNSLMTGIELANLVEENDMVLDLMDVTGKGKKISENIDQICHDVKKIYEDYQNKWQFALDEKDIKDIIEALAYDDSLERAIENDELEEYLELEKHFEKEKTQTKGRGR